MFQSVFIQRVFLQNIPDLRVFLALGVYFGRGFGFTCLYHSLGNFEQYIFMFWEEKEVIFLKVQNPIGWVGSSVPEKRPKIPPPPFLE